MGNFGYFNDLNREYVITRPDTPTPWMNYLGVDDQYVGVISNTAGGYSYHISPTFKCITRYRYNAIPQDRPGKYVYIKDNESKDYWSTTWQPVKKPLDKFSYTCYHGLSYTKIETIYSDIFSSNLYFVPLKKNFEIWCIKIKNTSSQTRNLSIFTYTEFCTWYIYKDLLNLDATLSETEMEYKDGTVYHYTYTDADKSLGELQFIRYYAFFTSNIKPETFDIRRDKFIGLYRDESAPEAIERGFCSNYQVKSNNPIASFHIPLKLQSGEEKTLIFILGITDKKYEEKKYIKEYLDVKNVNSEFENLNKYWLNYLSSFQTHTPDDRFNSIVNIWNQYQAKMSFSKIVTLYYTYWRNGFGFRDRNQTNLGILHAEPQIVKKSLITLSKFQYKNGDCSHGYEVLSNRSSGGGFSDDPLWFVYSVCSYIKETGDINFLKKVLPFKDKMEASIYKRIKLCCDWTYKNLGKHKLPLTGIADWNDGLNQRDGGESQMVACQLVKACKEIEELAKFLKIKEDEKKYSKIAKEMQKTINQVAWDGKWYIRSFDKFGKRIGSRENKEGKIFLNAQTWAVISGTADESRARICMDSVEEYLSTKFGLLLLTPPYHTYTPTVGSLTIFLPGFKENGSIFCHANTWAVIAECILGNGDKAMEYFKNYAPYFKNELIEIRKIEPYAYNEFCIGPAHEEFGEGRVPWLTGTVPWSFVALTQYILGIRPQYNGLLIDPCIPKNWDQFKVERKFRNTLYEIIVKNPQHISKGVKTILVDQKPISSNVVPIYKDQKKHYVEVIMG